MTCVQVVRINTDRPAMKQVEFIFNIVRNEADINKAVEVARSAKDATSVKNSMRIKGRWQICAS